MAQLLTRAALSLMLLDSAFAQRYGASEQQPIGGFHYTEACPDYTQYSSFPQYVFALIPPSRAGAANVLGANCLATAVP